MRTRAAWTGWLALGLATALSAGVWVRPAVSEPEFETASDLLSALETADGGLRRLSAGVQYTKLNVVDGDMQMRVGKLQFASDPQAGGEPDRRRFAVEFTEFYRGERKEEDIQTYAFDGQWLMEKHPKEKEFHLRQVVRAGEQFDPLKIGQGPFPLPIGQKKDDILAEYDAQLVAADDGLTLADPEGASDEERRRASALLALAADCWQVRLTPRAGKDLDFSEVRLWYRRDESGRLLPRMVRTVAATDGPDIEGDVAIVCLINVKVNERAEAREELFDVTRPEGWRGTVDELPKAGRPGGGLGTPPGR